MLLLLLLMMLSLHFIVDFCWVMWRGVGGLMAEAGHRAIALALAFALDLATASNTRIHSVWFRFVLYALSFRYINLV